MKLNAIAATVGAMRKAYEADLERLKSENAKNRVRAKLAACDEIAAALTQGGVGRTGLTYREAAGLVKPERDSAADLQADADAAAQEEPAKSGEK